MLHFVEPTKVGFAWSEESGVIIEGVLGYEERAKSIVIRRASDLALLIFPKQFVRRWGALDVSPASPEVSS